MSTAYEKFVQEVYQSLVNQSDVANVNVQHDITLVGKSGATHQIDAFWTFEIAGQQYRTCIECKHYSSPVKKSHVAAFVGVLADVGNVNGIFVTTEGYQKGAKLLANQASIRLILLNPTINAVELTMVLQIPQITNFKLEWDEERCRPLLEAAGVKAVRFTVDGRSARLRDAGGKRPTSLTPLLAS